MEWDGNTQLRQSLREIAWGLEAREINKQELHTSVQMTTVLWREEKFWPKKEKRKKLLVIRKWADGKS